MKSPNQCNYCLAQGLSGMSYLQRRTARGARRSRSQRGKIWSFRDLSIYYESRDHLRDFI